MKSTFFKWAKNIVATIILILSIYSLYIDANYFLTRREATAKILSINRPGSYDPYKVKLEYDNTYLNQRVEGIAEYKTQLIDDFKRKKYANVYYAKDAHNTLFLKEYQSPKLPILIFDIVMIGLMAVAILPLKKSYISNQIQ